MWQQVRGIALAIAIVVICVSGAHAATVYVTVDGFDAPTCGSKEAPCRSISRAIGLAATVTGDKIVVGPGHYGDLDGDGVLGEAGEETPAAGCGCMLAVNKAVSLTSSHGAAATIVDARTSASAQNVLLIADGAELGAPGKGFTITPTAGVSSKGLIIDSGNVTIRGNHVLALGGNGGFGIATVDAAQTMLIEGNLVQGWSTGISAPGGNKTVRKNQISLNSTGINVTGGRVVGNIVTRNSGNGIAMRGATEATGNAVHGNGYTGFIVYVPFSGTVEHNNITGNGSNDPFSNDFNCGVNSDVVGLALGTNYWGGPAGPGGDPADDVCTFGGGSTLPVTSFATKRYNVMVKLKP